MPERHCIEWNGEHWQSVFPSSDADKSQLHTTIDDALLYMCHECGVSDGVVVKLNDYHG